ncbi:hypothetical protein K2P56_04585 [Patescibacteria group bacterium]|nr:hypothetical protein [Patescibacteria group bacterium]
MLIQTWADVLTASFQNLWLGIIAFVPNIIVAVIIFVLGWLVGAALGRIIAQVIKAIKLDAALKNTGLNEAVERAGFTLDSGAFLGMLVQWFFIIVFLMASLEVLGLTQVNLFLQNVVLAYLPQVIVAALILLVGAVVAQVAKDIVGGAAKAAGVHGAGFAGSIAMWAVWIFTLIAALDQLQVAQAFIQTLYTGVIIAVSLAVGLAFGLGGQEAAARAIEKMRSQLGDK